MVGESINKVLVNYPAVDAACHISMSSLDVTGGLLNGSNTTYGACATMDECTEMCQTVTTSVAITIAFVTGAIMVRTRTYVHVRTLCTYMHPLMYMYVPVHTVCIVVLLYMCTNVLLTCLCVYYCMLCIECLPYHCAACHPLLTT